MKRRTRRFMALIMVLSMSACLMFSSCKSTGTGSENVSPEPVSETVEMPQVVDAVPELFIYIDETAEGYGTIEDMNADYFHDVRCTGTVDLTVPDGFISEYTDVPQEELHDVQLDYIRGRGNSTWSLDKKPYKIKFEEKLDLFGMGESKNWALLANRFDNSQMRNRVTFYLGEQMGLPYTPKCVPVNVYMNDRYLGSYLLSELVDIEDNRVGIDELEEGDISGDAVTGGYLITLLIPEYAIRTIKDENLFATSRGVLFMNDTPEFDSEGTGVPEQKEYIDNYLQKTEDLIYSNAGFDKINEYLDLESAADYWLIEEFCSNEDGFITSSSYLYKERGGKLYFGPLWDFDSSWDYNTFEPRATEGFHTTSMPWIDHLRQECPEFAALIRERFEVLDASLEELTKDGGVMDRYRLQTASSWEKDKEELGIFDRNMYMTLEEGDENADLTQEEAVSVLKKWINDRRAWMNNHLDEIDDVYYTVTLKVNGEVYDTIEGVKAGSCAKTSLIAPDNMQLVFDGWWKDGNPKEVLENTPITEDSVFEAGYVGMDTVGAAEKLAFEFDEYWFSLDGGLYKPNYTTLPYEAVDRQLEWKSSDEKIATVDERGYVTPVAPGKVTITGKFLRSGGKGAYTLHIYDPADSKFTVFPGFDPEGTEAEMEVGESYKPLIEMPKDGPFKGIITMVSESYDEEIATVDENGVITAVAEGETYVVYTIIDGTRKRGTFEVALTVKAGQ